MAEISESCCSVFADHGSLTPSEHSDNDEHSEHDSDYESDSVGDDIERRESFNIQWTGYGKRIPIILFNVNAVCNERSCFKTVGVKFHLTYKFTTTACKIIQNILQSHGFLEVKPNNPECNLIWSNSHPRPTSYRFMSNFQKINHFPRSYELTRKDRLCKNIKRMQYVKGHKHFNFIPTSFVLPGEYREFCASFTKSKGLYIVKPVASSQGRGVFLVNHPDQVPESEPLIVSKYISSPLVINDFKFDLRIYVAVTSYDPLIIYLYEEGLTRFATVRYTNDVRYMKNQCMHLTNCSVNKRNRYYIRNENPDVEDYGNKWSMGAMLRHLKSEGKDTAALMMQIESVVIKTIMSVEQLIVNACKLYQPFRGNCFELYGFDILIDETLKPWVLEVNMSPSLACDTPLDLKIKCNMLCDLFSLIGIVCQDPSMRNKPQVTRQTQETMTRMTGRLATCSYLTARSKTEEYRDDVSITGLNSKDIKILRQVREEEARKGGWIRIFPNPDSWDLYGTYLQFSDRSNWMLHNRLYPDRHKEVTASKSIGIIDAQPSLSKFKELVANESNGTISARPSLSKNKVQHSLSKREHFQQEKFLDSCARALNRMKQYEGMLGQTKSTQKSFNRETQRSKKFYELIEDESYKDDNGSCDTGEHAETVLSGKIDRRRSRFTKLRDSTKTPGIFADKEKEVKNVYDSTKTTALGGPDGICCSSSTASKHDVISLLQSGHILSDVQVRTAFAKYLTQVQERFLSNWNTILQQADVNSVNEQMKLIFEFLKCAASNLPLPLHIIVPSMKLPLGVRKKMLAKQLGNFINLYCKETERLREIEFSKKLYNKKLRRSQSCESLNEMTFSEFVSNATENELEQVLLIYATNNKSEAVFLGRDSKLAIGAFFWKKDELLQCCDGSPKSSYSSMTIGAMGDMTGNSKRLDMVAVKTSRTASHHASARHHHHSSPHSYNGAAVAYTHKLRRPWSATSNGTSSSGRASRSVSAAAKARLQMSRSNTSNPIVDTCSITALQDSLRRLSLKHQYSFSNGEAVKSETQSMRIPSKVSHPVSSTRRLSVTADDHLAKRLFTGDNFIRQPSHSDLYSPKPTQTQQRAVEAFNNYIKAQNPQLKSDKARKEASPRHHLTLVSHINRRPNNRRWIRERVHGKKSISDCLPQEGPQLQ